MTEPLDELIQRVLDGDASPTEKLRLEQRLASDAHARNRYDELARVFEALSATRLEEAPAGLRDDVLRSVREAALARTPGTARTGVPTPRAARPAFSWFRLALPIAAGAVAVAVLFVSLGGPRRIAGDQVSGTLAPPAAPANLVLGTGPDAVTIQPVAIPGGAELRVSAGAAPVTIHLEGADGAVQLAEGPGAPAAALDLPLAASATVTLHVHAPAPGARVQVRITYPDGRVLSGVVPVDAPAHTR